jgi:hypothetical protein
MESMRIWQVLLALCLGLACFGETPKPGATIRGKLTQRAGKPPVLTTPDGKMVTLDGTPDALKVLNDARLNGFELEAHGHFTAPDRFTVGENHARALVVHKHGHVKMITYWCDVCSIRSYAPGVCWCCQAETDLDLRDPDQP